MFLERFCHFSGVLSSAEQSRSFREYLSKACAEKKKINNLKYSISCKFKSNSANFQIVSAIFFASQREWKNALVALKSDSSLEQ